MLLLLLYYLPALLIALRRKTHIEPTVSINWSNSFRGKFSFRAIRIGLCILHSILIQTLLVYLTLYVKQIDIKNRNEKKKKNRFERSVNEVYSRDTVKPDKFIEQW